MRAKRAWLVAVVFVLGCEDPPESYHYDFQFEADSADELADLPREAPISLDGVELGVARGPDRMRAEIPASTWVSESTVTTTPDATTCGDEARPLDVSLTLAEEEGERQNQADSDYPSQTPVWVRMQLPAPRPRALLLLDNHEGTSELQVQVGQQTLRIPPGEHRREMVILGDCGESTVVRVAAEEVANLDDIDEDHMLLIDGTGTHCYLWQTVAYGDAVNLEPERYPAARAQAVRRAAHVFGRAPNSTVVRVAPGERGLARTTQLGRMECAASERAGSSQ